MAVLLGTGCASHQKPGHSSETPPPPGVRAVILYVADLHSRLRPSVESPGYPALTGWISARKNYWKSKDVSVLAIAGGDVVTKGSLACRKTDEGPCFQALGQIGLDWVVLGNAELKFKLEDLKKNIHSSGVQWSSANVLAANGKPVPWSPEFVWAPTGLSKEIQFVSWTKSEAPLGDFKKNGFRVLDWDPQATVLSSTPSQPNSRERVQMFLPHLEWDQAIKAAGGLCGGSSSWIFALKANDHVSRSAKLPCMTLIEPAPFGQELVEVMLSGDAQVLAHRIHQVDQRHLQDPQALAVQNWVDTLYAKSAPEADAVKFSLQSQMSEADLALMLAESFRVAGRADVGIVNLGAIKNGLRAGAVRTEDLALALPYEDPLLGWDWSFSDMERSLCLAQQRVRDPESDWGSDLILAGAQLEDAGSPKCRLVVHGKNGIKGGVGLKVAASSYVVSRSRRWLGADVRGKTFSFGFDTVKALDFGLSQGVLRP